MKLNIYVHVQYERQSVTVLFTSEMHPDFFHTRMHAARGIGAVKYIRFWTHVGIFFSIFWMHIRIFFRYFLSMFLMHCSGDALDLDLHFYFARLYSSL